MVTLLRGAYTPTFQTTSIVGYCCSEILEVKDAVGNVIGWKAGGSIKPLYFTGFVTSGSSPFYRYFVSSDTDVIETYGATAWTGYYWYGINDYAGGGKYGAAEFYPNNSSPPDRDNALSFKKYTFQYTGGSVIGKVSSASNLAYPTASGGGKSGDYWYTYLGSDSIDPTAISYPTEQLRPGDTLTVSIEPSANTYGGTISYLYQYSINGGNSWVTIQTTAATSVSFTIPTNAKSIQFRARAQDDMGFTSATYVTGAAVTVERLNLWVGVNGKARKGMELYVGVDGKARKVTAAYIGVNGKARRFL